MIISVNQLSIYGAVADMCDELACRISGCSERTGELVAQDNPETTVISTELSTTNKTPRTNDEVQVNLLHDYWRRGNISRPSTMRNWTNWEAHVASKVKGWIRGHTKIGPALEVAVSHRQGRHGIEIMIESFFGDGTWNKQTRDGND